MKLLSVLELVRGACLEAAIRAYEEAGIRGLCADGRWEAAVSAVRALDLQDLPVVASRSGDSGSGGGEKRREAWLSGPVEGVPTTLGPAAHSLLDALAEAETAVADLPPPTLTMRPGGAASIEFHLRHAAGAIDRLLTYASGGALTAAQRAALAIEGDPRDPAPTAEELLGELRSAVDAALFVYRDTSENSLEQPRQVGRARLPSTVRGLLYHAAEHTRRHTGQAVTTARVLRGGLDRED